MIEPQRIVGFQWDDGNASKSHDKHGVTQNEAEQVFFNEPLIVTDDLRHSRTEPQNHALGKTLEGRRLHITFTMRGDDDVIRVVSARDMNRRERDIYEQET